MSVITDVHRHPGVAMLRCVKTGDRVLIEAAGAARLDSQNMGGLDRNS
jgi:hypothetical protein